MKLSGKFEYLGIDTFTSSKDSTKKYNTVVLMQGTDVVKVFANDETVAKFNGVKRLDTIECGLNVNVGSDKTFIGVENVKKVS